MRMSDITSPSVTCLVVLHFSALSHKGTIFGGKKKVIEYKIRVLNFSTNFVSKRRYVTTTLLCVISQKSSDLLC